MKFKRKMLSEQEIIKGLRALKDIPGRDPEIINSSKNAYLAEITKTSSSVSASQEARHIGWIANLLLRKEPLRMSTLGTIILIISLNRWRKRCHSRISTEQSPGQQPLPGEITDRGYPVQFLPAIPMPSGSYPCN